MNNINFEDAIRRLEEIVSKLDSKDISLDEAMKLFEEGTILCKKCDEDLKKAELVIKKFGEEQ